MEIMKVRAYDETDVKRMIENRSLCPKSGIDNKSAQTRPEPHLQPGPVNFWLDKLGQLYPHFPLLLNWIKNGVEDNHGTFVLQQRHIHHTFQSFKGSIFSPVLHNVERFAASQKLDTGQL